MPLNHLAPVFEAALAFHGGKDEAADNAGDGDVDGEEGGDGAGERGEPGDEGTEGGGEEEAAEEAFDGFIGRDGGG